MSDSCSATSTTASILMCFSELVEAQANIYELGNILRQLQNLNAAQSAAGGSSNGAEHIEVSHVTYFNYSVLIDVPCTSTFCADRRPCR